MSTAEATSIVLSGIAHGWITKPALRMACKVPKCPKEKGRPGRKPMSYEERKAARFASRRRYKMRKRVGFFHPEPLVYSLFLHMPKSGQTKAEHNQQQRECMRRLRAQRKTLPRPLDL